MPRNGHHVGWQPSPASGTQWTWTYLTSTGAASSHGTTDWCVLLILSFMFNVLTELRVQLWPLAAEVMNCCRNAPTKTIANSIVFLLISQRMQHVAVAVPKQTTNRMAQKCQLKLIDVNVAEISLVWVRACNITYYHSSPSSGRVQVGLKLLPDRIKRTYLVFSVVIYRNTSRLSNDVFRQ